MSRKPRYDLFISYAHADNQGEHAGKVTELYETIMAEHALIYPDDPLEIFFDADGIRTNDYWKQKIYHAVDQSAVMLAIVSPNYFASDWCRREWETFTQLELSSFMNVI